MIIGIDISSLPYGTGVSSYTLNLVRNLLKIDNKNIYKLFYSSLRQPLSKDIKILKKFHHNLKIYHYPFPPTFLEFLWNRLHLLPIELLIGECHVFHTWEWMQPPTLTAKTVTTIHDLVPFIFPETQHKHTIQVFKRKMALAIKYCHGFICVSKSTQNDLLTYFPQINPEKTAIIYEAAEEKYYQFNRKLAKYRFQKINQLKKIYGLNNFILAQGTREPRKNLNRLIEAFQMYKQNYPHSNMVLAISGKYGWGTDISLESRKDIKVLGYIPEKDMVALHAAATILVYPSLYEGFGLPILKSMAVGTPTITSQSSSLPEIGGNAAIYVNPLETDSIYDAIKKVLTEPQLRQKLKKLGLKQARKFSWTKMAQETLNYYEKIST